MKAWRAAVARGAAWVLAGSGVGLGAGCTLTVPPPMTVVGAQGVAHGEDLGETRRVAAALDELAPQVREMLPGVRPRSLPLEVWLVEFGAQRGRWEAAGLSVRDRGLIMLERGATESSERATLVHELVHQMLDDSWATLPLVAEEGLCDSVAVVLVPEEAAALRADRLVSAARIEDDGTLLVEWPSADPGGAFSRIQPETWTPIDPRAALTVRGWEMDPRHDGDPVPQYYGLGFLIVQRILARSGIEDLHSLAMEAAAAGRDVVAPEALLHAAALPADPVQWRGIVASMLGPEPTRALLDLQIGVVAEHLVAEALRRRGLLPRDLLRDLCPRLRCGWADSSVELAEVPELQAVLAHYFAAGPADDYASPVDTPTLIFVPER